MESDYGESIHISVLILLLKHLTYADAVPSPKLPFYAVPLSSLFPKYSSIDNEAKIDLISNLK